MRERKSKIKINYKIKKKKGLAGTEVGGLTNQTLNQPRTRPKHGTMVRFWFSHSRNRNCLAQLAISEPLTCLPWGFPPKCFACLLQRDAEGTATSSGHFLLCYAIDFEGFICAPKQTSHLLNVSSQRFNNIIYLCSIFSLSVMLRSN